MDQLGVLGIEILKVEVMTHLLEGVNDKTHSFRNL